MFRIKKMISLVLLGWFFWVYSVVTVICLNGLSAILSILTVNMSLFPPFLFYDKPDIFGFWTVGLPKQAIWKCHSDSEMDVLLLLSNSERPLNPNTSMDNFQNVPLSVIITPVCQEQMEMSSDGVIEWQVHRWRRGGSMSSKLTGFFFYLYLSRELSLKALLSFQEHCDDIHTVTHGSCSVQPQFDLPAAEQLGLSSRTLYLSGGNEGRASTAFHFYWQNSVHKLASLTYRPKQHGIVGNVQ